MSIVQTIRDKGAWIIFAIIVLAMLAFIFQDSSVRGSLGSRPTYVGSVNGEEIKQDVFNERLERILAQPPQQGQMPPTRDRMVGELWNYDVSQALLKQECAKLGLTVTGKEISDFLVNTPPQWLQQQFTDANGVYDQAKALDAFNQMKKKSTGKDAELVYEQYIEPIENQLLSQKYSALLSQAAYVPKWLSEKTIADNNATATAQYVYLPYSSIADSTIKVTDDEIRAYEKKHSSEFQQEEETRNASYVSFMVQPSKEDSIEIFKSIQNLYTDFGSASNVKAYLTKVNSATQEEPVYKYIKDIREPYTDSIIKMGNGNVFGPYLNNDSYQLSKLLGTKNIPDSVNVRHILISFNDPATKQTRDDSSAKKLVDSLQTAIAGGANFDSLCARYSADGNAKTGGKYENVAFGRMVPSFNEFIFANPTGSKGVVRSDYGYHYIEVLSQKGSTPAAKIAYLNKPLKASQATLDAAESLATSFAANNSTYKEFEENAKKQNLQVMVATDVTKNDVGLMGLGNKREMVKWMYNNKVGNVSDPYDLQDKFVVMAITGINEKGLWSASKARPLAERFIRNEKIAQKLLAKFKGPSIDDYAKSTGAQITNAEGVDFKTSTIGGIGNEPKIVGVIFNKSLVGKVSEPIAGNTGVFVIKPGAVTVKTTPETADAVKLELENLIRQAGYRSNEALKKAAKIVDNRADFY